MAINLKGAYTRLRDNSKSAMMAAIEIYNKPNFDYRDECCVILFINSWELLLKALLSKNKKRIFYEKKRNQPYQTFSLKHSLTKAKPYFPPGVGFDEVDANLKALADYRNNAIHFYNADGMSGVLYNLAQACIMNYGDILKYSFGIDLASEINIVLLPLSLGRMPLDPIQFIDQDNFSGSYSKEVTEFLRTVGSAYSDLDSKGANVFRFLVTFSIKYESVKKTREAIAVVGIDNSSSNTTAIRKCDPNNFLRQKDVLERLPTTIDGIKVNSRTVQAYIWFNEIKDKKHLCWAHKSGSLTTYSPELVSMIKNSTGSELQDAREKYSIYQSRNRKS